MLLLAEIEERQGVGLSAASLSLLLGVSTGALLGAWLNVFVWGNFDPKFVEARIVPFVFDFLFLEILVASTLELILLVSWRFATPSLKRLRPWHFGGVGLVLCLLTTVILATTSP